MNGGVPGGGNGAMFRARSEKDAEVHARDLATRGARRRHSRRELVIVGVLFTWIMAAWGLFALVA